MRRTDWNLLFPLTLLAVALSAPLASAAINYTGDTYFQNFDSLTTSTTAVTWTNDATLPGWSLFRKPAPGTALTEYRGGTGSSNTGSFYSFGQDGDRALGGVGSGGAYYGSPATNSIAGWMAVSLTNGTGSTLNSFDVKFDGEQWRYSGTEAAQPMILEYGFGNSFETVGSWIAPGGNFDFVSPVTSGAAGALNGNVDPNRTADLGGEISGVNWSAGSTLWLRWLELNDAVNDHGLAVDNFEFSTGSVVEPIETGDFDEDGDVDGRDFLAWQRGAEVGFPTLADGDGNADGFVDGLDLAIWQDQYNTVPPFSGFTAVPEPGTFLLAAMCLVGLSGSRRNISVTV
jgi:hypothetical protein